MSGPSDPQSEVDSEQSNSSVRNRVEGLVSHMRGGGLRARTLRGASWTTIGFGAQQVLRLGSNLVLTRLLVPEHFGLMALAQVFSQGLAMLSDIGVGPSIVQNPRGDDPDFLATAWTMQVIRGFTLALGMCLLAYPASLFYEEPILFPLLLLVSIGSVIKGFQSIGIPTATRSMQLGRLAIVDFISHCIGIIAMIVWAYFSPDVWALVGGGIIAAVFRLILGYSMLPSKGSRFHFERDAAGQIFHFGKWIFLATAMTYFGGQGLRLIQGSLVSMTVLGMIAIAGSIAMPARIVIDRIVGGVLFPAFAEINRKDPDRFVERVRQTRFRVILAIFPFFLICILFGQHIIAFLYDSRYHQAGIYFVILSTSTAIRLMRVFFAETMFVKDDSYGHAFVMFFNSGLHILGVVFGYLIGDIIGMLWGGVVAELLIYPLAVLRVRRHRVWVPSIDLLMIVVYVSLAGYITYRHLLATGVTEGGIG
jgi:O-antigen/teichoic acid export membrane protein